MLRVSSAVPRIWQTREILWLKRWATYISLSINGRDDHQPCYATMVCKWQENREFWLSALGYPPNLEPFLAHRRNWWVNILLGSQAPYHWFKSPVSTLTQVVFHYHSHFTERLVGRWGGLGPRRLLGRPQPLDRLLRLPVAHLGLGLTLLKFPTGSHRLSRPDQHVRASSPLPALLEVLPGPLPLGLHESGGKDTRELKKRRLLTGKQLGLRQPTASLRSSQISVRRPPTPPL